MSGPVVHCWESWGNTLPEEERWRQFSEMSKTCMLLDGHDGPHEWTDDDRITFTFADGHGDHDAAAAAADRARDQERDEG